MPFKPPQWTSPLSHVPDTVSIADFMLDEKHGRRTFQLSRPPFVCGTTGQSWSASEVKERVDILASGLASEFRWRPNEGRALDKVICIFSVNTVDYLPLVWAIHRVGGVATPANSQFSASDLAGQLRDSGASSIFTCLPLLQTALNAADAAGIPKSRVYLMDVPVAASISPTSFEGIEFKSIGQLLRLHSHLPKLEPLNWTEGEAKEQVGFLCYSSGTSGLPKGVMISHYNVIASVMQVCSFEQLSRDQRKQTLGDWEYTEAVLGLLPLSHIYGLVMIAHCAAFRGDSVVVLSRLELKHCLRVIQDYKISTLFLVPPIIILMMRSPDLLRQYDLDNVKAIFTGAAPLARETADELAKLYPAWLIRQAYGLTETCSVVSSTADFDAWSGSAGSLITGIEARVVTLQGEEVTEHGKRGELWIKTPCLVLGYLNNEKANKETFMTDEHGHKWMRTGDEVTFKRSPRGHEHLFVIDRIKELIKVKGFQVAPAELEAHLLLSPYVADCAVIAVADDDAGEVPKAFVVKSPDVCSGQPDDAIREMIIQHVRQQKSHHKWLKGGVEFLEVIPKSPSGKILRRVLKSREQEGRKRRQLKL